MNKFKKFSAVIFSAFMFLSVIACPVFAGGKYAKVIFLSGRGTGKTSVLHVLVTGEQAPLRPEHTEDINVREKFFEFDESEQHYSVNTKLWDTSGERVHKQFIKDFCTNATVAIITLDLEKLGKKPYTTELAREITWNWIDELNEVAPNCKLVFVGTKKDKVEGIEFDQAKESVRHLANFDSVRGRVGERIMYVSAQKDNPQEICDNLNRLIADAIKAYGLANLQDRPTKMSAKLVKHTPPKAVKKTMHVDGSFFPRFAQDIEYTVYEDGTPTFAIEYYGEF